jgi:2-C-methyl-D-erythritol 4-phosphate cytidylyltransferase
LTRKEYALIVAGGKGTRFNSSVPKQFLELNGKPLLLHTLEAFYQYSNALEIVLVLPEEDQVTWEEICKKYGFEKPLQLETGGATRFESVRNGLKKVGDEGLVAIHDGVRPLVTRDIIAASFELAAIHGSAVAAVQLKDSLRVIDPSGQGMPASKKSQSVERSLYRLIQTPQTFRSELIKQAYALTDDIHLTDDASVAERAGHSVFLFEGSYENIKITTPEDLVIARALCNYRTAGKEW